VRLSSVNHRQNNSSRFEFEPQGVILERGFMRSNDPKLSHGAKTEDSPNAGGAP
jgi:hypothetical protein